MAYRTTARKHEIVIESTTASFWMRLRRSLGGLVRFSAVALAVIAFAALLITGLQLLMGWAWTYASWVLVASGILWVVFVVPLFVRAVIAAATPNPMERVIPRRLALSAESVGVTPHDAPPYDARWTFLTGYRVESRRIVLVLSRSPVLEMELPNEVLDGAARQQLLTWLDVNAVPRA